MLKLLGALSRGQRAYVFLGIDLMLIPVVLLFTYAVQALPTSPLETLRASLPVLPYLMLIAAALSKWLGLAQYPVESLRALCHRADRALRPGAGRGAGGAVLDRRTGACRWAPM